MDIEEIGNNYQLNFIKPKSDYFVINLESSEEGNETHWMGSKLKDKDYVNFDSYGMLPPEVINLFSKKCLIQ